LAVTSVTLAQSLRPWRAAGLTHILAGRPVAELAAALDEAHSVCGPAMDAAEQQAAIQPAARPVPTAKRPIAGRPRAPAASPQALEQSPVSPSPLAPAGWPDAWRRLLAKTRPAPVVWTYSELGLDLSGVGSPERGSLLRRLIAGLCLPRGASAFWPSALPVENTAGTFAPDAEIFFAGLERLSPRLVVLFGHTTLADAGIDPALLPALQQAVIKGRLFVHAPAMADLLASDRTIAVLASLLRGVADVLRLGDR